MAIQIKTYCFCILISISWTSTLGNHYSLDSIGPRLLKEGDQVPDVTLHSIINFPMKSARVSELTDKLLILDFWATWCIPCVRAFPKIDSLQKKFQKEVLFMPVTGEDQTIIKNFMNKVKSRNLFDLPTAIDTVLYKYFMESNSKFAGQYVWIKNGRVLAYSGSKALTVENINAALNGTTMKNIRNGFRSFLPEVFTKPLLAQHAYAGADTSTLYFSTITGYINHLETNLQTAVKSNYTSYRVINNSIFFLYLFSYSEYFRETHQVLLEVAEPDKFKPSLESDTTNLYCYEKTVPNTNLDAFRQSMKHDLDDRFGYKISREMRSVNCAVIRKTSRYRALPKSVTSFREFNSFYLTARNVLFADIVNGLRHFALNKDLPYIIDETNISEHVDLELTGDLSNLKVLKNELGKYGLELTIEKRLMEMTIVRDNTDRKSQSIE